MADFLERLRAAVSGRYAVERELGRGGMATVYLAQDLRHQRAVAIKVLDEDLAGALGPERFVREIETAARLHHPHVLPLLDSGVDGGLFFYVMPYVAGESLRARLAIEGQLGQEEAVRLASEVARALDYAHRNGIVHRDIKPENILLVDGQAVVGDFGIARAIRASGGEKLTRTGVTLGSPAYMSPEQTTGERDVDGRSDLYSLGCVLYEMLAGQPPFSGPAETMVYQHLNLAPRPVRDLRPTVSPELDAVITRALAKTPGDRFASGAEFASALGAAQGTTSATMRPAVESAPAPPAAPAPAPTATPRRRLPRALLYGVPLLLVAIAGFALWRAGVFGGKSTEPTARRWVWLAEFEGPPDDPSLAPAARDLVAGALDQSTTLASVPVEQMRMALRNSKRPDSTRITPDIARELAFRSSIPVVVEGRIGKLGARYNVVLRATNSENATLLATENGTADNDRELVPVLTRLARDLRRALGENEAAFRTAATWMDAPTASFEAFKLALRGRNLINAGDPWSATAMFRQALQLDPDYASAWIGLSTAYSNMNRQDSMRWACGEALRREEQLKPYQRFEVQASLARLNEDYATMNALYDAMLKLDLPPVQRAVALNNKSLALSELNQIEDGYRALEESGRLWPVQAPTVTRTNLADQLIGMKRYPEARTMMAPLVSANDPSVAVSRMECELADREFDRGESLAVIIANDVNMRPVPRTVANIVRASVRAIRGDLQTSRDILIELDRTLRAAGADVTPIASINFSLFWADRLAGRTLLPLPPLGASPWGITLRAQRAALAGDSATARRELAAWPSGHLPHSHRALAANVEGCLDWRAGRWERVIGHLRPGALGRSRGLPNIERVLRTSARWLVADAFQHLNQPDSAIAYLNLILDPPSNEPPTLFMRGLFEPWARGRLVRLHLQRGRMDEARRELDVLASTCTRPDPIVAAMLDESRAALQSARAMNAPSRR